MTQPISPTESERPEPRPDTAGNAPLTSRTRTPPIVGIGASAGGLEAFTRLVANLRDDTGLAYVLVQHLDPDHKSLLPEILDRAAPVPVVAAADGMAIEANQVYVIPPGAAMTVSDGHLRVVQRERARGVHTVIDAFLSSLSEVHGSDAVGVILSGAGSDGARGIEAIKERGGITFAQDPISAQFSSMPESAVATGFVDLVLPPEEIADQLVQIGRLSTDRLHGGERPDEIEADIGRILTLLRNRTGVDFRLYRTGTVRRRIVRRMLTHRSERHDEYLDLVRSDPTELDLLCEDILIGVTRFFRDPDAFEVLQKTGFPEVTKGKPPAAPIRIWVAGCSGGEEAYSVAILALEHVAGAGLHTPVQVFATDLKDAAITRARAGLYPHSIEGDVSPDRLNRFFVREEGGYRITRKVRDMCVFARHNLVHDPPFSQIDIVTCRNVLIYFDAPLQERAMEVFHYALKASGILMLGGAESAGTDHFVPMDKRHKLYRPYPRARRPLQLTVGVPLAPVPPIAAFRRASPGDRRSPHAIQLDADRAVLARFAPPGVVVNPSLEIVHFRGDTSGFMQHAPGVASLHLLKLVRPEFLPLLRSAVEQASSDGKAVRHEGITLRDGDIVRRVAVEIIPFRSGAPGELFFAILFETAMNPPVTLAPESDNGGNGTSARSPLPSAGPDEDREIARLVEELAEAKRYLQDVIEQYEAANEELRAASEEIQSSNEELQSTNEELETTKEEVQSTNEELTTVNEELRHRNRELAGISGDLANVFASTQIPIVIVDSTLSIRRFTPVSDRVMKIIATDVGRPLGDVRLRFDAGDLEAQVQRVISTLELYQIEVQDDQGRWWTLTIRPYLTIDRKIDGAVLVFTDVDASKKFGEQAVETAEHRRRLLMEAEEARAEASTANLAKMHFLANMSHDLRTPLNAITGYADLMELRIHGPLTPEQETDLARVKRSARHLLSLINDILNYAKIESGQLDLQIGPLRVEETVTALEEIVFPQVRAKGLDLDVAACEGSVLADREKLQQVLLNLVTNAIKFTTAGGIGVRCTTSDSTIAIAITDTGMGIPADKIGLIFDPFIQIARSLTNVKHEGVGLGLSISRDLARAMGGDITVQSAVGRGSVFTVTLPRHME